AASAPSAVDEAPPALPVTAAAPAAPPISAPLDERRPATTLAVSSQDAPVPPAAPARFARDYDALPVTIEARFGLNTRLGASFDDAAHEQLLDSTFALAAYLAWSSEYAVGLEFEHAGLGRVRGVSDESSIDTQYSATGGWLAARVFPWRNERWDVFVNLRLGLVFEHVDTLGTRPTSTSITVPPSAFSCSVTDGPGFGLGGALGATFRLSRHVSVLSRLDATGERLSGDVLGTCADGIGSVTTVSGTLGVAYEFETSH
ncbi:MAG TPA: hypothetical protein VIK01_26070, partial [Polyangiaceae bacterium]